MIEILVRLLTAFIPSKELRQKLRMKSYRTRLVNNYGDKHIYSSEDAQSLIYNLLKSNKPCLICRFGGTEMRVVDQFLKNKNKKQKFSPKIRNMIATLSGFFPANEYQLTRFASEHLALLKHTDAIGIWNTKSEQYVCENYLNDDTVLVRLNAINPITAQKPWSKALEGKKVLVIHPFEDSIKKQYANREFLFANKDILPKFELITMKPVQSLADNKDDLPYKTWFEALDAMKEQINKIDFDVAIIGAGAYGIFLAHHCKMIGKQAVHMGGATQTLFGIIGKRWETEYKDSVGKLINEHWTRPLETERPKGASKVEGGCYW